MTVLRKISLPFVLLALMLLVAHSVVPHHHTDEADLLCVSPSVTTDKEHDHDPQTALSQSCLYDNNCAQDTVCGLSHSYLSNHAEPEIVAPLCQIIENLIHEPHCRHCAAMYVVPEAPIIELLRVCSAARRAPPVVC